MVCSLRGRPGSSPHGRLRLCPLTILDQLCGVKGSNHEYHYDPTQPESVDTLVEIDNESLWVRHYTREIFRGLARIHNPAWKNYEKPELKQLLRDSDACVLVYSCTSRDYHELLVNGWAEVVSEQDASEAPARRHLWVVHDNLDIDQSMWQVSLDEGRQWAGTIGAHFRALSSRTGEGTKDFNTEIITRVLRPQDFLLESPAATEQNEVTRKGLRWSLRNILHKRH